jgi:hypothetical protein
MSNALDPAVKQRDVTLPQLHDAPRIYRGVQGRRIAGDLPQGMYMINFSGKDKSQTIPNVFQ